MFDANGHKCSGSHFFCRGEVDDSETLWLAGRALRARHPFAAQGVAPEARRSARTRRARRGRNRMLMSPFAFLRGAAAVMAEDLRHQSATGISVQACGDCHLMNFGAFATPEENILFDINDFD